MAEQQTALITAGGSGIGLQMAHQFLANGYQVAITDIDKAALNAAQQAFAFSYLSAGRCLQWDSMRAVEHELDNRWARLDVVMANAGIAGPTSYVEDVTGRLETLYRCEFGWRLSGLPVCSPPDETTRLWCHYTHLFNSRAVWLSVSFALCCGKMGHYRADENIGDGIGAVSCAGQCHLSRGR